MKIKVLRPVEIEITHIHLSLPVRYEEEDMPNDFPLRIGELWEAMVEIDSGRIEDWPQGKEGEFYMKVVDMGTYTLYGPSPKDGSRAVLAELNEEYVPHGVVPGEWGDYVHLKINGHGVITNWPRPSRMNFEAFGFLSPTNE